MTKNIVVKGQFEVKKQGGKPNGVQNKNGNKKKSVKKSPVGIRKLLRGKQHGTNATRMFFESKKKGIERVEYILDANDFIPRHDVVLKFDDNDVCILWETLKEFNGLKRGTEKRNVDVRMAIDLLLRLVESVPMNELHKGVPLKDFVKVKPGKDPRLFFNPLDPEKLKDYLANSTEADERQLFEILERMEREKGKALTKRRHQVFITQDKLLRILALLVGIPVEGLLLNAVDEEKLIKSNIHSFPIDTLVQTQNVEPEEIENSDLPAVLHEFKGRALRDVITNDFLTLTGAKGKNLSFLVRRKSSPEMAWLRELDDYQIAKKVFGINALNESQNYALNVALDPRIKLVIIDGAIGTGKDLVTLAAACDQMFNYNRFRSILASRVPKSVGGHKAGEVPGSADKKMRVWMDGIVDNLEFLYDIMADVLFPLPEPTQTPRELLTLNMPIKTTTRKKGEKNGKLSIEEMRERFHKWMTQDIITFKPLSMVQGASHHKKFIILDEAQDLTDVEFKNFITRLGEGSKMVAIGSFQQRGDFSFIGRDIPFGKVIEESIGMEWAARVTLTKNERSDVSAHYAERL